MGYADGYYYGQGRIICDTSTFSVGDTIRVRSVYNALQTEDKQVVTVGTPLIFTVPPYDYYKICRVQTINDTPTEIGGEYVEIGFGDLHRSNVLDKNTLGGIQGILNAHQETDLLAIGDEITIKVGGVDWVMQVAGIDLNSSHEVMLVSKEIWDTTKFTTTGSLVNYTTATALLRNKMGDFYNAIVSNDKQYIKKMLRPTKQGNSTSYQQYEDFVYPPSFLECTGSTINNTTPPITLHQFPLFVTQANRVKTYNGTAMNWWTCDGGSGTTDAAVVQANGTTSIATNATTNTYGVLPCFRLTADS